MWSHKGTEITTLHGHKQSAMGCAIYVKIKERQNLERTTEESDWAAMAEEEEWKSQHDKAKLDKKDVRVEDVLIASCGEEGNVRVWRPLQVTSWWGGNMARGWRPLQVRAGGVATWSGDREEGNVRGTSWWGGDEEDGGCSKQGW